MDGLAFGFHELGDPMTLQEFRAVFKGPIMGNCGYTEETAEKAISEGHADMIAFGRPFISNPDLVNDSLPIPRLPKRQILRLGTVPRLLKGTPTFHPTRSKIKISGHPS